MAAGTVPLADILYDPACGDAARRNLGGYPSMRKWLDGFPTVKFVLIGVAIVLWVFGLVDTIRSDDVMQVAKYIGLSLLLVVVSRI